MKKRTKVLSCLTVGALAASVFSVTVSAENDIGQKVRVIIENNTLTAEDGADWTGVLADEWVAVSDDTTAVSAFLSVLDEKGYTQQGAEYDYITEINGLSAEDGGSMGGWMVSLDNWITDEAISAYTISSGKLEGGDEIRFSYSCSWGADLGYSWSDADTSLAGITFSAGELTPDFVSDETDYVLTLPEGVTDLTVSPDVKNKGYRAKVYKNTYTPAENGTDYKLSEKISVEDGDVIIVGIANAAWMQANYNNVEESVYQFHINKETVKTDIKVQEAENLIAAIGEVTAESGKAISDARNCYDALTDEQKAQVTNAEVLIAAETAFAQIQPISSVITTEEFKTLYSSAIDAEYAYGNEWDIINLCRFGIASDKNKQDYIKSVKDTLTDMENPLLSKTRSTVNSGVITALTACGADPTDFYGYNLLQPLADFDYVNQQGINGAIYALIALDSHAYEIPEAAEGTTQASRESLIDAILQAQESDGGWTIDTWSDTDDGSDADMTAMALQALAPYEQTNENVKAAVDKALDFLSANQNEKGQFRSYGSYDCESLAQTLTALCALKINVQTDERFIKDNNTVYTALTAFYNEKDNGFSHFESGEVNYISTYQAYTAIAALYRYENDQTTFFDMTDTELTVYRDEQPSEPESTTESDTTKESSVASSETSKTDAVSVIEPSDNVRTGDSPAVLMVLCSLLAVSAACTVLTRKKCSK